MLEKIVKIIPMGVRKTIDIEVTGNHLFFANDILTHNSATTLINGGESMNQSHVQGGSSKTNTSDLMIAAVKTDAMHAAGEYRFEFPKARNSGASGKQVMMKWDPVSLRISDMNSIDFKPKTGLNMASVVPGKAPASIDSLVNGLNF